MVPNKFFSIESEAMLTKTHVFLFRFIKTILTTKFITAIDLKVHGQFPHKTMVGLYQTLLQKHFRSRYGHSYHWLYILASSYYRKRRSTIAVFIT